MLQNFVDNYRHVRENVTLTCFINNFMRQEFIMSVSQVLFAQAANFDGSSVPMAAGIVATAVRQGSDKVVELLGSFGINARGDSLANTQALRQQMAPLSNGARAEVARMACSVM